MTLDYDVIRLADKFALLEGPWEPRVVAAMNEILFKVARIEGEFVWHKHQETDEAFLVISGEMEMELRDRTVRLKAGDLYVVPAGVEHRPGSKAGCDVVVIEPEGTRNTGDAENDLTIETDVWLV